MKTIRPPKNPPNRMKRMMIFAILAEVSVSPALLLMEDGPPKIITAGVWFGILLLTFVALFVIGIATSNR